MLEIVNIDESDKWDSMVKSFSNYDVYYLSGYTKAFKLHGDGEPTLIYYHDEEIRAINVVMIRDIAEDKRFKDKIESKSLFDITTPYGYGGFIIEGIPNDNNLKKFNEEYSDYCRSKNIISEFLRFHPILKNSKINSEIYEVIDLGKTITMDLISKEQIWNDLSSKNRNVIRKAIKSGVEIYWGRSPELIDEFIPLYNATMNKDDATDYYYFNKEFYKSVLEDLRYNNLIFYALYDQKVISMSMILFGKDNMHYHLSASDREYQSLASTNLLLYEAACWGCENGYKSFHLGGGLGSKEDSLFKFKKAFNKNSETYFSIGRKIFDQEKYDELIEIRLQEEDFDTKTTFFPKYRK
ncbi:lipid II:glycine glycyltransferase FemX [Acidaminobacter hydrogenoformans]|uniref:Acetyltransferase (GNAT) domain-containing protein n=1 Tax=Acidaminobacter hydrogenoformans DSM 2784 TaxID=1120920 RepID=A0A1G5S4Y6_9FIRM|nr:GNAT family N-acetyltransferase [Acidaminobacter hydrogenoformans]SCZ81393.1 Acetyltransferase (GNAT) domain-containing protein [Acidaminobacter hydrogenoformans DSM 2784]